MRKCKKCGIEKPLEEFVRHRKEELSICINHLKGDKGR